MTASSCPKRPSSEATAKDKRKAQKALERQQELKELEEFKQGLESLSLLADVMESGEFGLLIGKREDRLTKGDIPLIKSRIRDILENNKVLGDANIFQPTSEDTFKVITRRIDSEGGKWASTIVGSALAWTSVGFFASVGVATMPIAMLLGGSVLVALGVRESKINRSIKTAAKVMSLTQAWTKMGRSGNPNIDDRGIFRKMFDKLRMKSPKQIKREAIQEAEENTKEAAKRFEKIAKDMPEVIRYTDERGMTKEYPVARLFTRS